MDNLPRIRTLLDFLPTGSMGLATSVCGRLGFLLLADALVLISLRSHPLSVAPHALLFATAVSAMWCSGVRNFLSGRSPRMLLLACLFVGTINAALPPANIPATLDSAIAYGSARMFAFAAMAFSTLLVASITRPSDFARLALRLRVSWFPFLLAAIPFATLDAVASRFRDTLLIVGARYAPLPFAIRSRVVDIGASVFASTLQMSLHHYQLGVVARPLTWRPGDVSHRLTPSPLLTWHDLLFLLLVMPVLLVLILL